jgi:hypothetical protein
MMDNDMHPDDMSPNDTIRADMNTAPTSSGSSVRKGLTIGLAAGLLGGAAAGFAFGVPGLSGASSPSAVQQTESTVPSTDPASDPTVAPTSDPAPDVERGTRLREALQPLVDDGTITAAQADAVVTQLQESLPGRGEGHGGRGGGDHGRFGFPFDGEVLETLGIDVATLREQLQAGSSLAEIAEAQGIDIQPLIDALIAEGSERIDEAVAAGRIDEAEAATRKAELETRITELVNTSFDGSFGDWGGRGRSGGRPGAESGTTESDTTEDTTSDDTAPDDTTPDDTTPVTTED